MATEEQKEKIRESLRALKDHPKKPIVLTEEEIEMIVSGDDCVFDESSDSGKMMGAEIVSKSGARIFRKIN
jgi:hypothetical protein